MATFHDPRSSPDAVPWGRWRLVQNMATVDGDWQLRCGWRRHGHWTDHPDVADLRIRPDDNEDPIRSLYLHISPSGSRRLFAASSSIYSQFHDGRWRALAAGSVGERYQFAGVGDTVFATNNVDPVRYHVVDSTAFKEIPSLASIGLHRAGMIAAWKGLLFLGDVQMDGIRIGHRLVWSDLENPLQFEPTTDSVAGFQDLNPGETILAGIPMGDYLYLFTTQSVWRVTVVGGDAFLSFQQVYHDRNGAGCLISRYAICVWKDTAIYLSRLGIQTFGTYSAAPEQPPWMFHATFDIETANLARCKEISMGVRARYSEVWISYPKGQSPAANRTIVLNMDYESTDEVDHGFTAILPAQLDESLEVIEWLRTHAGCSSDEVDLIFPPTPGEYRPEFDGDPKSLSDFCQDEAAFPECNGCPGEERFLIVSAEDGALKVVESDFFARTQWTGAEYEALGYSARWVTGALHFGNTNWKRATEVSLGLVPVVSTDPRTLRLLVSSSGSPSDVLAPHCGVRSFTMKDRAIECAASAANTQPNAHLRWPFIVEGRYVYLDFQVPSAVGGAFSITRLSLTVGQSPNSTA